MSNSIIHNRLIIPPYTFEGLNNPNIHPFHSSEEHNITAEEVFRPAEEHNIVAEEVFRLAEEHNIMAEEAFRPAEEHNIAAEEAFRPAEEHNIAAEELFGSTVSVVICGVILFHCYDYQHLTTNKPNSSPFWVPSSARSSDFVVVVSNLQIASLGVYVVQYDDGEVCEIMKE